MDTFHMEPAPRREARENFGYTQCGTTYNMDTHHTNPVSSRGTRENMDYPRSDTIYNRDTYHTRPASRREARENLDISYPQCDTIYNRDTHPNHVERREARENIAYPRHNITSSTNSNQKMSNAPQTANKTRYCPRCDAAYNVSSHCYRFMADARRAERARKTCPRCGTLDTYNELPGVHCEAKEEMDYPRPGAGEVTSRPQTGSGSATGTKPPPFSGPKIGGAQPLRVANVDMPCESTSYADHTRCDVIRRANNYHAARIDRNAPLPDDLRSPHHTRFIYREEMTTGLQPDYGQPIHTDGIRSGGAYVPWEDLGFGNGGLASTREHSDANNGTDRGYTIGQTRASHPDVVKSQSNQPGSDSTDRDSVIRPEKHQAWRSGTVLEDQDVWLDEGASGFMQPGGADLKIRTHSSYFEPGWDASCQIGFTDDHSRTSTHPWLTGVGTIDSA